MNNSYYNINLPFVNNVSRETSDLLSTVFVCMTGLYLKVKLLLNYILL